MSNWGNSNCFELFVPKVKGLENWFYYCSLVILLTMDTVGGHRSHRLRIAVLLGYNTCHCRLLDVVMFSYSIVKRDECNNGERKSFFWFCCCWLQCKVCMQTFICTTSEVKCKEHAEARHPKSDLVTCFPHLKKWKTNNLIMYLEMGLKPSSVCILLWVKIRKL